jgi:hypothetical protein
MTLGLIREGLRTALESAGFRAYDDLSNPVPPCVVVMLPEQIDVSVTMTGQRTRWIYRIPLEVRVPVQSMRAAVDDLEAMLAEGETSVIAAIRDDKTLGGVCQSADTIDVSGFSQVGGEDGTQVQYLRCRVICRVVT